METLSHFIDSLHWEMPWLALIFLLPLFIKRISSHNDERSFEGIIAPHLRPYVLIFPQQTRRSTRILWLAWLMASLAAAGPFIYNPSVATPSINPVPPSRDIMVILDISRSMNAQDIAPNRLTRAQQELQEMVSLLHNERLALVVYAANAYLVLPFTQDYATFLHFVKSLSSDLATRQGSNIIQALELSRTLFNASATPASSALNHDLVLLSDGETPLPPKEWRNVAQRLKSNGIRVHTLGIGTVTGGVILTADSRVFEFRGQPVVSRLNRQELQELSQSTQGQYSGLTADNQDWQHILAALSPINKPAQSNTPATTFNQKTPLFPLFLGISLGIFLMQIKQGRRLLPVFILLISIAPPFPVHASPLNSYYEYKGQQALKNKDMDKAQDYYKKSNAYIGAMGQGVSLYRQQDWQGAIHVFTTALNKSRSPHEQETARYNLGNALAQAGDYKRAAQRYKQVLHLHPEHKQASINLNQVNQYLDTLKLNREKKKRKTTLSKSTRALSTAKDQKIKSIMPKNTPSKLQEKSSNTPRNKARIEITYEPSKLSLKKPQTLLRHQFSQQDKQQQSIDFGVPW